jgi:hypothetical protein
LQLNTLKEAGFTWLSSYVSFAITTYGFLEWLFDNANEGAFNAQVQYYLWYRADSVSEEEMRRMSAFRDFIDTLNLDDFDKRKS